MAAKALTAEEILSGVEPDAEDLLAEEPIQRGPATAGFFESLPQIPGQILRSGGGMEGVRQHVLDLALAQTGDREAAKRVQAFGILASTVGSVVPGGPALRAGRALVPALASRAGLGAAGGAIGGGLESASRGDDIVAGAGSGAVLGAVLNPAVGAAGAVVQRLLRQGKEVPAEALERARKEVVADPLTDPVSRLTQALKVAPDLRAEQARLTRAGRARQIKAFEAAGEGLTGEARAAAKLKAMAGPLEKVDFGSLRPLLNQADVDGLFQMAETSPLIAGFERARAVSVLRDLLKPEGVKLPQPAELKLLERLFGPGLVQTLVEKRGALGAWEKIGRPLINSSREMMATADLSAPLRQGLLIGAGHPVSWGKAFGSMFKYAADPRHLRDLEASIVQDPLYELADRYKLALTKAGSVLGEHEEQFGGSLARRIPGLKPIIEGSERAYTGFLNKLRFDVFKGMVRDAEKAGLPLDDTAMKQITGFINAASGRGNLPEWALLHADTANVLFFSPRLMAGRLQTLHPALYIRSNPVVRQHAIRSALALGTMTSTALGLAALGGAEVDTDPTSSDFAKIKVGNTRFDILGGFQQYGVLGARIAQAVAEEQGTERFKKIGGVSGTFMRNKLAPIPSLVADIFFPRRGEVDVPLEVMNRFTPMVLQDVVEAMQDMGWIGLATLAPATFGVSVQTYE